MYTDDSDPVAAAIHSGFIRGEWGEEVDVSLLDLEIKEQHGHAPHPSGATKVSKNSASDATIKSDSNDRQQSESSKHRMPPVPPADKDLHITLLILPSLERYESSVMYGLKSRNWGGNHDGMSFKIERIDWVDEGSSKGQERGGEARRKRLKSMMRSGRICTAAGLKGKSGVELQNRKQRPGVEMGMNSPEEEPASLKAVESVS